MGFKADAGFVSADAADDGGKERVGYGCQIAQGGWGRNTGHDGLGCRCCGRRNVVTAITISQMAGTRKVKRGVWPGDLRNFNPLQFAVCKELAVMAAAAGCRLDYPTWIVAGRLSGAARSFCELLGRALAFSVRSELAAFAPSGNSAK
jgi:hypothetical protein